VVEEEKGENEEGYGRGIKLHWKSRIVANCTGLENLSPKGLRGFESHLFRSLCSRNCWGSKALIRVFCTLHTNPTSSAMSNVAIGKSDLPLIRPINCSSYLFFL
jgi:hypothetical protein